MAIIKKDAYFGEGISSYGETDPKKAFSNHRESIRIKRLSDLLGNDPKLSLREIENKFPEIKAALEAADKQVMNDNNKFMQEHGIVI
jgi:hypothetical protein